jgi:ABC-type branched-subunit amino acid transport system substrate-binding protein
MVTGGRAGPSPAQDPAEPLFREAERAYQQKDYGRARVLYRTLLASYPQTRFATDASFRLAELFYYGGQYEECQRAFEAFLRQFPHASLAPDAAHLQGLCLLHLRRYDQAQGVLERALQRFPHPRHQAYLRLALAKVAAAAGERLRAIEELRALVTQRDYPEEARQQARSLAASLIEQQLTPEERALLKARWPLEFPTDDILLQEARRAWSQTRVDQAEAAAQEFLTKFPDRPQAAEMRELLAAIEQRRTVAVDRHKIGVVLPLSGPRRRAWVSEVGQSALQGIQLAFAREGFTPLKLEVRDSKADLAVTAAIVDELVNTHRVIAIVGPLLNETVEVAAQKALQYRVPLVTPGAPSLPTPMDHPYLVRTSMTTQLEARRLAEYAVGSLGLRRFAILYPDDQPGRLAADTFRQRVSELGGEVVSQVSYPPTQVDFTPAMRRLGGKTDEELQREGLPSGPGQQDLVALRNAPGRLAYEALYLPRSFERLHFLIPALTLYNIAGITVLGESGWNHPELVRRAGSFVEGAIFMDGFFAGSSDPQVRAFVDDYRSMFNAVPDLVAAQSYDAMLMLLRALRQRPHTRDEVMHKLRSLKEFRGATGRASVLPTGDVDKRLFALTVRRGEIVQLD